MNVKHCGLLIAACGLVVAETACYFGRCTHPVLWGDCKGGRVGERTILIGPVQDSSPSVLMPQTGPFLVGIGDTLRLEVYGLGFPERGYYPGGVYWSSSDDHVAEVLPQVLRAWVVAKKTGTTTIWVKAAGMQDSATVTVQPNPIPTKS